MSLARIVPPLVVAMLLLLAAPPARAAGFQYGTAPDPDDKPLELGIWYPSDAATEAQPLGLFTQDVAYYGAIAGQSLRLIVISHGTGGGGASHYDTAMALADAGFVVVALTHTGDNYQDHAYSFTRRNFAERPRQVSRVIDFMLNSWDGHDHLDATRIGMFGHSAGAVTALILAGANPDFAGRSAFCHLHTEDWGCQQGAKELGDVKSSPGSGGKLEWSHDKRIKAISVAAPGLAGAFTKEALAGVSIPVQLWRAEDDKIDPNRWYGDVVRDDLPKPPEDHLVANAGHFDFLAPCVDALAKIAPEICNSAPGFDRTAFHADFNKALAAFFKTQLAPASP